MAGGDVDEAARVIVVGGGLAGLAAAARLAERGRPVTVIEARRNLGGRAASFRDPASGEWVDHCQHVSLGCCTAWAEFCQMTGLAHDMQREATLHFYGPDGRRYDFRGVGWLPPPLHLAPGLLRLGYLSLAERVRVARAMLALRRVVPRFDDPSAETIGAWLRAHGQSERAIERFWAPVIVSALSESVDRAALAHARKVFVEGFMATRHGYEMEVPSAPLAKLYDGRLAGWLIAHGVQMRLGAPVERIEGDARRATGVRLADGTRLSAGHVICAVPWRRCAELFDAEMASALPWLAGLAQIESAPITGVHLWYDRELTPLPHAVLGERMSQWLFNKGRAELDVSPTPGEPTARTVCHAYQVVISASRELSGRDRDEIRDTVDRELRAVFPKASAARLLAARIVTQQQAVFSVLPGIDRLRPPQQTAVEGLSIAGDWTATGWPATMESAIRSGFAAAEGVG